MHFYFPVESDKRVLWLQFLDQIGAMTRSLDLNHPTITDIWMTECSKKRRGKTILYCFYSLGTTATRPPDSTHFIAHTKIESCAKQNFSFLLSNNTILECFQYSHSQKIHCQGKERRLKFQDRDDDEKGTTVVYVAMKTAPLKSVPKKLHIKFFSH